MFKPQYKTGLVLGKFMPLHKGHEYLIRFAQQYCEQLTVVVDCLGGQTIDPLTRKSWVEQQCPGVRVVALPSPTPQDPSETPQFWDIWRDTLITAVGGPPDVLVAAMDYGAPLANALGCVFIPLDIARESITISATEIRNDPFTHWEFLAESAREHYLKKVCLMGPESTGKSTCAAAVAAELGTTYVPEYAKTLIERQQGQFFERNVLEVAQAQYRSEKALSRAANRILLCDTNLLTTLIWSDVLFGGHPLELEEAVRQAHYDLTLVLSPDVPWVDDIHRRVLPDAKNEDVRRQFFDTCVTWLSRLGQPYAVIDGALSERPARVLQHCQSLTSRRH